MKEYALRSLPARKSKLTIGFLDENLYLEFHNQKMAGVFEAARKYNANIVRFTDYTSNTSYQYASRTNMVLEHIEQYALDGLIFIGWTKAVYDNFKNFVERFASIPLLSLGTVYENIPHIHFPGGKYIREILSHLVNIHHFKRIAYIAPFRADERNEVYINTMKEYDLYDPGLFINIPEQECSNLSGRAKRALAILLDERKLKFDAIMSMYNEETAVLLNELKYRGIHVPQDIAVTSYEDSDIGKFSSPALTTVYYPWFELGFYGCEKMIQLLTHGHISFSTEVSGRTIYRNSCGCMSNPVKTAGNCMMEASAGTLETMSTTQRKAIIAKMTTTFPNSKLDFDRLLEAFLHDFRNRADTYFLAELIMQLKNFPYGFNNCNIENLISIFRQCLLPYLADHEETILWSGDIFQQSQILLWEKVSNIDGQEKVSTKIFNQALQDINHILVADFSIRNLMDSLAQTLPKLRIPSCYILIFNFLFDFDTDNPDNFSDDCVLAFEYCDNIRIHSGENRPVRTKEFISGLLVETNKFHAFLAHLLHVGDDFMGFILFEPGPVDERIYQSLSAHISTTLRGSILLEKLEFNYKKLAERAHQEGMADVSTEILHNMGNILNSINVSVSLMKEALGPSFTNLTKANTLLKENIHHIESFIHANPKSAKLWRFYLKLGDSFSGLKIQLLYHINRLNRKLNSINEIITAQQNYAGIQGTMEALDIVSVLEDALKLHAELLNNYQISIIRDYQVIPQVLVPRIKLFHILIHLINNALEAMQETPPQDRKLKITIDADHQRKYIRITDNGCGISADLLEKIFEYGYTTKKNGKGLGLHSCAGYMTEMSGKIWAESNGPGTGATFVLQFK